MTDLHRWDDDSPCPPPNRAALTRDFEREWPDLEPALKRFVVSRGVAVHEVDDLTQEVALRVLRRGQRFQTAEDLRRYCFVVARNLCADLGHLRRRTAGRVVELGFEDKAAADRLDQVEDRLLLRNVAVALDELAPRDRLALAPTSMTASPAERNRAAVARHRARTRLRALVGPLAGVLTPVGALVRRLLKGSRPVVLAPAALSLLLLVGTGVVSAPAPGPAPAGLGPRPAVSSGPRSAVGTGGTGSASRAPRRVAPAASVTGARSSPQPSTVVRVTGPAGAHAGVATRPQKADDPLLCMDDPHDAAPPTCADVPTLQTSCPQPPYVGPVCEPLVEPTTS
jgi:hypothetical protein